jgi:saccharopine dehydrogenase-like NADP-dependent oxidoreductase
MLKRLGLLTQEKRELLKSLLTPILATGAPDDLVFLNVKATAPSGESFTREILDFKDAATGFTAMERMTAFPAVAVLELALEGRLRPGAVKVECDLPFADYWHRLTRRGIAANGAAGNGNGGRARSNGAHA